MVVITKRTNGILKYGEESSGIYASNGGKGGRKIGLSKLRAEFYMACIFKHEHFLVWTVMNTKISD